MISEIDPTNLLHTFIHSLIHQIFIWWYLFDGNMGSPARAALRFLVLHSALACIYCLAGSDYQGV